MKKITILMLLTAMPLLASAQANTWEQEEQQQAAQQKANPDAKYLEGAVPQDENGMVTFSTTISCPGKTADQVYDIVGRLLTHMTKEENQLEHSAILQADATAHQVMAHFEEWLVFKNTGLVLDRTRMGYVVIADCSDGEAKIRLTRITYLYEEERDPQRYKAEEWISDKYALNKKHTRLTPGSAKFRRKTVDRVENIFNRLADALR